MFVANVLDVAEHGPLHNLEDHNHALGHPNILGKYVNKFSRTMERSHIILDRMWVKDLAGTGDEFWELRDFGGMVAFDSHLDNPVGIDRPGIGCWRGHDAGCWRFASARHLRVGRRCYGHAGNQEHGGCERTARHGRAVSRHNSVENSRGDSNVPMRGRTTGRLRGIPEAAAQPQAENCLPKNRLALSAAPQLGCELFAGMAHFSTFFLRVDA